MSFKLNCWIVLVSVVCAVLAKQEVNKNFYEENESDNNTLVYEVIFQQTECNCGEEATNCELKEGEKVCTCRDGYVPAGQEVICTQKCDSTNSCENGGICLQNVCKCLNGTSGHLCKTIDDCSSICGTADCGYNVMSRDVYCKCRKGYAFDDTTKMCRYCDCGTYERSCSFEKGKNKCKCMDAYADNRGTCEFCICKDYSTMYGCHFDSSGEMKCNCIRGFAQVDDECQKCDCKMEGSNCTIEYGLKYCHCPEGFESDKDRLINPTCTDIDECAEWSACFDTHAKCVNTPGSYRCDCKAGYYKKLDTYKEKYNSCIEESRPWRVASIVLGCLFSVVILGLLIAIYNQD